MRGFLVFALACVSGSVLAADAPNVIVRETTIELPTYLAAPPSPVPRFYEGRTYQGAKALFYPYPVQDVLTGVKTNQGYRALYLQNGDVGISVLPELGGRIFSAQDKHNGYDFFYRQHVIKPALIGMLGAWISGGVEWNVPHHHRASSFMPVNYTTTTNADGSATIWVGETELRHGLQWMVGMTLHPGRSYLELTCKVANPTPFAHPMLFWINPAVHCDTNYQVIFPPSTEWAVQHAKPEFASWPIARQVYGGNDYTRGVDISWWKNHSTPVSFFAWNYEDDWFGGYDHGRRAGVVHFADHHVVPGKKFFEWGNGAEGDMWTKILSDEDGPYLELMAGAWSDNQPDYSWIQPGETREWQHWWYPVREMGGVKAATRDVAANLEVTNNVARIAANATTEFAGARVKLTSSEGKELLARAIDLSPAKPFTAEVPISADVQPEQLRLSITASDGKELIAYQPAKPKNTQMPKPVERPRAPKDYSSIDELYYTGQRIEQLYSPSFEAAPYYQEILRRDAGDYRANTAMGMLLCKQWRWGEAIQHLNAAIARSTSNYIRPRDVEAFYYLGVALRAQGKLTEAAEAFQKTLWNPAWHASAGLALAEIEMHQGQFREALTHVDLALNASVRNAQVRSVKAAILRNLERPAEAEKIAAETVAMQPLNIRARSEQVLAQMQQGKEVWREQVGMLRGLLGRDPDAYLQNAFGYAAGGQWREVATIMRDQLEGAKTGQATAVPTQAYLMAYALEKLGRSDEARTWWQAGAQMDTAFCFPSRHEEEPIFRRAMEVNPQDANAPYLLGCLLYDNQPGAALRAWEEARSRGGKNALVHRNVALAYAQYEKHVSKAIASLEMAVEMDPREPRFLYELDMQYEAGGAPVAKRLDMFVRHHETAAARDDALTREIQLLTVAGQPERALELLKSRRFRNWEGSSQIHSVYVDACLAQGRLLMDRRDHGGALSAFQAALEYPENLEVGRARRSPRGAQVHYLIGSAYEAAGKASEAKAAFESAVARKEGSASENQYYYALALQKLGRDSEATPIFERLVKVGAEQFTEPADYFAKFGEKQTERVRKANAHFLTALGHAGLGEKREARRELKAALDLHPAHLGAVTHMTKL